MFGPSAIVGGVSTPLAVVPGDEVWLFYVVFIEVTAGNPASCQFEINALPAFTIVLNAAGNIASVRFALNAGDTLSATLAGVLVTAANVTASAARLLI